MTVTTIAFSGTDASWPRNLYVDDGTTLRALSPANTFATSTGFAPASIVSYTNGTALFQGRDASGARDLWVTDGTDAGTVPIVVTGASTAANGLFPNALTAFNGLIYFSGIDSAGLRNLWRTDGTTVGTFEVTVPNARTTGNGLTPGNLKVSSGKLFFTGTDAAGFSTLYVTDGASTTRLLPGSASDATFNPLALMPFGGGVLFNATSTGNPNSLWFSDGTVAGTTLVTNAGLSSGNGLNPSGGATLGNGKQVFAGIFPAANNSIYVTDGTAGGTLHRSPSNTGPTSGGGLGPSSFFTFNPLVYFQGSRAPVSGSFGIPGLWVSDGTDAGTVPVTVNGASASAFNPHGFFSLNGFMYFLGADTGDVEMLWKSDGTTGGTSGIGNTGTLALANAAPVTLAACYARARVSRRRGATSRSRRCGKATGCAVICPEIWCRCAGSATAVSI